MRELENAKYVIEQMEKHGLYMYDPGIGRPVHIIMRKGDVAAVGAVNSTDELRAFLEGAVWARADVYSGKKASKP